MGTWIGSKLLMCSCEIGSTSFVLLRMLKNLMPYILAETRVAKLMGCSGPCLKNMVGSLW